MDTISRENNSSMLPIFGVIVGGLALVIGGWAAVSLSNVKKSLTDMQPKIDKIEGIESTVNTAAAKADKAARDINTVTNETNGAMKTVGDYLSGLNERMTKVEDAVKKAPAPVAAAGKKGGGEVVAGPNEYIVKAGDASGAKIARDHGISLADLQKVNPDVNWTSLKIGQKLKMPVAKK
jgi:LysM repeat protein